MGKLDTIIKFTHLLLGIALCTLCMVISLFVYHVNQSLTKADALVVDTSATVKRADLLIKQASYLTLQSGLTMNQVRLESIHESLVLDQTNKQVSKTLTDLDSFVLTSTQGESKLLATANETVQNVNPVLIQSQDTLASLQVAAVGLGKLIADPSIPKTLQAVQKSSEATEMTMNNVADTSADVKQYVHHLLHPKWTRSVANWTLAVGHALNPL